MVERKKKKLFSECQVIKETNNITVELFKTDDSKWGDESERVQLSKVDTALSCVDVWFAMLLGESV